MFRKTMSLTLFFTGLLVLVTSVVMYYEPEGRVAYWADWRLLGLTKEQWGDIHVTNGFLFLLALLAHTWLNFSAMVSYLKNKAREMVVFTKPTVISLALTVFVTVGALLGWPPMRQVLELGSWFKESHVATYGLPPYGHAELTALDTFARQMGLDYDASLANLTAAGMRVRGPEESIKSIATNNTTTPQHVYEVMRASGPAGGATLPPEPPAGFGKLTLNTIVAEYKLDTSAVSREFTAAGLVADGNKTIKEIAEAGNRQPRELYDLLRAAAATPPAATPIMSDKGPGRMTLQEAVAAYGLDEAKARAVLASKNIPVSPDATLRDLAEAANMNPHELLELMR